VPFRACQVARLEVRLADVLVRPLVPWVDREGAFVVLEGELIAAEVAIRVTEIVLQVGIAITVLSGIPVLWQLSRGHPKGLFVLFFAEMWERFSYYGMRGLLVFYMTEQFLFKDTAAQGQYGAYTSLVYLVPLLGGLLADLYLGTRKAIAFGAMLLVCGHLLMAFEGPPAQQTLTFSGTVFNSFVRLIKPALRSRHLNVRFDAQAVQLEWSGTAKRVTAARFSSNPIRPTSL